MIMAEIDCWVPMSLGLQLDAKLGHYSIPDDLHGIETSKQFPEIFLQCSNGLAWSNTGKYVERNLLLSQAEQVQQPLLGCEVSSIMLQTIINVSKGSFVYCAFRPFTRSIGLL
jgi:hypothetical protein